MYWPAWLNQQPEMGIDLMSEEVESFTAGTRRGNPGHPENERADARANQAIDNMQAELA